MNNAVTSSWNRSVRNRAVGAALSLATAWPAVALAPVPTAPPLQPARENSTARDDGVPRRLIARFDFEENAVFPKEIPTGFYRALARVGGEQKGPALPQGGEEAIPGLRNFGRIETVRGSGRAPAKGDPSWAVRFTVDGASMMLASEPSKVAVVPGAQLLIRAWGRTDGLQYANLRVSARFHDKDGKALGGVFSSNAMRSEGSWRMLAVEPPPAPPRAAGLSLWLEVVQPSSLRDFEEPYQPATDDVGGFAYFDDIEVWQVPTVEFDSEGGGVVLPGARPRLSMRCSDPSVARSTATVAVRDASDALVFQGAVEVPGDRSAKLDLPALATGWYEATVSFTQGATEISRRTARFTVLPDEPLETDDAPRFGTTFQVADERILPAIELSQSSFAVVPVWSAMTDVRDAKDDIEALRLLLGKLLDRRVNAVFRIAQVPASLARQNRVDIDDALALFALDETHWRSSLEPWLLAFGQQVDHWLIGTAPTDGNRGDLAARIESLAGAMRTAIAGPSVGLPWSPSESLPPDLLDTVTRGRHLIEVVVDPAWRPGDGEIYSGLPTGPRGLARIQPLSAGTVDDRARAVDLALRAIDAWRSGFDSIAVDVRLDAAQAVPGPSVELAAWRQLSQKLSGRRFQTEIPLSPSVRCMMADGARGAVLVVWSDAADATTEVVADLGNSAVLVTDLWGRSSKVSPTQRGHLLRIGREPVFVEGVDSKILRLRKTFRVDPAFALSRRAPQEAALVLGNPWANPISGTITILGPDQLEISPRSQSFTIAPGAEARLPISFSVPRSMPAGSPTISVLVQGIASEPFRTTLDAPLELGNRAVKIDPDWRLTRSIESGTVDVVLTLRVTNVSKQPLDIEAFAVADGYTQSRKPISALAPGMTAVRVFHFADGAQRLSGRDIRAGVHDPALDARALVRVPIPPLLPPTRSTTATASVGDLDSDIP